MTAHKFSPRDTINSAKKAEKSGDFEDAARLYGLVFSKVPRHAIAIKHLKQMHKKMTGVAGVTQNDINLLAALLSSGNSRKSVEVGIRLVCVAPNDAILHNLLGIAYLQLNRFDAAERHFRKAIRLRRNYPEAYGNLGTLLVKKEQYENALPFLENAVSQNPNIPEANNSMGIALHNLGRSQESFRYLDAAISGNPKYLDAYNTKGCIFKDLGDFSAAIETFEGALKIDDSDTELLTNLAYTLMDANKEHEAIRVLERAIKLDPMNKSEILMRLSTVQNQIGDRENSVLNIEKALLADPNNAEAYRLRSITVKYKRDAPEIRQMEDRLASYENNPEQAMHLEFALGKAYEDAGLPQKAFEHWVSGNRKRRQTLSYSIEDDRKLCGKIESTFSKEFIESCANSSSQSKRPMFIVGMMRSGTTLVEQILSSHSGVFGAGELSYVDNFVRHRIIDGDIHAAPMEEFTKGYLAYENLSVAASARVVDKMPINFLWIGYIKAAFPNAKIINLVRDPRDVALSIFKNYFIGGGNQYAYDLTELAEFYLLYRQMMAHWESVLPNAIHNISYECLVRDFESEARNLLDYCGLDWEDAVLKYQTTARTVRTASVSQVREPIYSKSVNKWQDFEDQLAPFIKVLNAAGVLRTSTPS